MKRKDWIETERCRKEAEKDLGKLVLARGAVRKIELRL